MPRASRDRTSDFGTARTRGAIAQLDAEGRHDLDLLYGGEGGDVIVGGAGDVGLEGGPGADRFAFAKGFDRDVISDFDADPKGGQDVIDLRDFGFKNIADFRGDVDVSVKISARMVFERGGPEIVLMGVAASTLGADDFLF